MMWPVDLVAQAIQTRSVIDAVEKAKQYRRLTGLSLPLEVLEPDPPTDPEPKKATLTRKK